MDLNVAPLFEPFNLGTVTVKNRLAMLPMGTRFPTDGRINERDNAWHIARAAGGVGLIITAGTLVSPSSMNRARINVEPWNDDNLEPMRRKAAGVHRHGAKLIAQLVHLGRETAGGQAERPQLAPSSIRANGQPYVPAEVSQTGILRISEEFAACSKRFALAGYDGVEIHAAHGYLLGQFLSPASNRRSDEFGGRNLESRAAFLLEVLRKVRSACGVDFAVGVRLSADEEVEGGLRVPDTIDVAKYLEESGLVTYLNITVGMRSTYVKDGSWAPGFSLPIGAQVRRESSLPVLLSGRIFTPEMALKALESGSADLVGLGRSLIADPEWANKTREGKAGRIRPCLGFAQDCRTAESGVACAVNARAGREAEHQFAQVTVDRRRRVSVVGGGPAGLEIARRASERGHQVTVYEQKDRLGGQLNLAARGPTRSELSGYVDFAEAELKAFGTTIHLGRRPTLDELRSEGSDLVVVATGPAVESPSYVGLSPGRTFSVWDVLSAKPPQFAGPVVVADDGVGFWPTLDAAQVVAAQGIQVFLTTPSPQVAGAVPAESLMGLLRRLKHLGVEVLPLTQVVAGGGESVVVRDVLTDEMRNLPAVSVVAAPRLRSDVSLANALRRFGVPAVAIGDCLAPRRLTHAIRDADLLIEAFEAGHVSEEFGYQLGHP